MRKRIIGSIAIVFALALAAPAQGVYPTSIEEGVPGQNTAVKTLERELGHETDGEWGNELTRSVRELQDDVGVKVDGVAGHQTVEAVRHPNGDNAKPGPIGREQAKWLGLSSLPAPVEIDEPLVVEGPAEEPAEPEAPAEPVETGGGDPGLEGLRQCESDGDYSTDTGNGYYGAYQFDQSTWESVGGSGNPAQASPTEQDARARALMAQSGSSPWPTCG